LLRGIALAVALLLLISPIFHYIRNSVERPQIILLSDSSASMDLLSGKQSKRSFLAAPARELADKFRQAGYELHTYDFAQGLSGDGDNTLLSPALTELAAKHDFSKVKGIVLVSDGWLRDESLAVVKQLNSPFYVLADTTTILSPDLSVVGVRANRHAYRGEPAIIRADVLSENYSGQVTVDLLLGNTKVASQTLNLSSGVQSSLDFTQRFSQTGFYPFRVQIGAAGISERTQSNNSYPGAIEVLSEKQQIIIISDKPAWDNKFIIDSIAENTRWEVKHYLLQDGRLVLGGQSVSTPSSSNLAAIVVINNGELKLSGEVLGFVSRSYQNGIGILWQGLPVDELSSILPLQRSNILSSYQGFLELGPAAASYPAISIESSELMDIPPLDYYFVTSAPGAEVLAQMNNPQKSPAVAIRSAGNNRVLAMAFLNLWKWQLQSNTGSYRKLLSSSMAWLANRSRSGYSPIYNSSYFRGEEIKLRLRAEDDIRALRLDLNPELKVIDANDKEVFSDFMTQSEGEYSLTLRLDQAGQYRFEIRDKVSGDTASGRFNVADTAIEARDFDYNLPLLTWLANDTGGKLLTPQSLQDFTPLPARSEQLQLRQEIPLYRKWYVLSLFILAFCLELFFRRRWGLL